MRRNSKFCVHFVQLNEYIENASMLVQRVTLLILLALWDIFSENFQMSPKGLPQFFDILQQNGY